MPLTNPRIIVVDDNQGIYNIVRASLELLGRLPRLIETHTGDDALLELRISSPDLLVTAHTLSGTTNGPMLALIAKRELAALPVLVLGSELDPEIDEETLSQSPFQYLRRPFLPETFLRALRVALDGPEAASPVAAPDEVLMPVPAVDEDKLRPILFKLMREVGAMAAVMADRNGKVIAYEGAAGYFDRDLMAAALGPGFGHTTKVLPVIGDQPRVLKYYEGDRLELYGLALGLHHFISLIFESNSGGRALGGVRRWGGNAVNEMLEIIGEVAFNTRPIAPPPPAPAPAPAKAEGGGRRSRRTQETHAVATPAPAKSSSAKHSQPAPEPAAAPMMEPIANFDPDLLNSLDQIDLSEAEALFDPERLAAASSMGGNKISFDDALLQGIIGPVDE
jgi:CheY-like chemotaxis protein